MPSRWIHIRVFVGSPDDLLDARQAFIELLNEFNESPCGAGRVAADRFRQPPGRERLNNQRSESLRKRFADLERLPTGRWRDAQAQRWYADGRRNERARKDYVAATEFYTYAYRISPDSKAGAKARDALMRLTGLDPAQLD